MIDKVVSITMSMSGHLLAKLQLPTVFTVFTSELVIPGFLYNQKRGISASKALLTSL